MKRDTRQSMRSCAGCRQNHPAELMVRFVLDPDGLLMLDYRGKLPGRGSHVCTEISCIQRAIKGGFARSFGTKITCGEGAAQNFYNEIATHARKRALDLLGILRKQNLLAMGHRATRECVNNIRGRLVILATDLSLRTESESLGLVRNTGLPVYRFDSMEAIGRSLGRPPVGVVTVLKAHKYASGLVQSLERELDRACKGNSERQQCAMQGATG